MKTKYLTLEELHRSHVDRLEVAKKMWTEFIDKTPDQLGYSIKDGNRIYERMRNKQIKKMAKETGLSISDLLTMLAFTKV